METACASFCSHSLPRASLSAPATAALKVGDKAPDFTTTGAVGGKEFKLHLADQLKKGPVVLYFFPKAFTSGCTAEAHAFSESIGDFKKAGAQVIGMSADNLKTLHEFSAKECRSAFPVATATPEIQKEYDVAWAAHPGNHDAHVLRHRQERQDRRWSTTISISASTSPRRSRRSKR